jgi:hypothetical protein
MFLKNYTSEVPVPQTIARMETLLIRAGVTGITKEYDPAAAGKIAAITFCIQLPENPPVTVRLPADEDAVQQALWVDYVNGDETTTDGKALLYPGNKKKTKADFRAQAERTAWKLVQDWLEVQLSMIAMRQADFVQVFLPYVWDGSRTYYQALKESKFRGLLAEKT